MRSFVFLICNSLGKYFLFLNFEIRYLYFSKKIQQILAFVLLFLELSNRLKMILDSPYDQKCQPFTLVSRRASTAVAPENSVIYMDNFVG